VIELDPVTKRWSAVFPELPGCASAGDIEDEAIANAEEALALWVAPVPLTLQTSKSNRRLKSPLKPYHLMG
jgi:predicted RNase H-like HicB family nuclease